METTLEDLSIKCLMEVLVSKACELLELATDLIECLCADCPPGEPGEVIAGEPGEVQVTAGSGSLMAGAITVKGNIVKGATRSRAFAEAEEIAKANVASKRGS